MTSICGPKKQVVSKKSGIINVKSKNLDDKFAVKIGPKCKVNMVISKDNFDCTVNPVLLDTKT